MNPYVVQVMQEDGLDISRNSTKSVFVLYQRGLSFDVVITVCSEKVAEKCPVFPGKVVRLDWPFEDPSSFAGSEEEILETTKIVRDQIKRKVNEFVEEYRANGLKLYLP